MVVVVVFCENKKPADRRNVRIRQSILQDPNDRNGVMEIGIFVENDPKFEPKDQSTNARVFLLSKVTRP